jgi:hypothetical protein
LFIESKKLNPSFKKYIPFASVENMTGGRANSPVDARLFEQPVQGPVLLQAEGLRISRENRIHIIKGPLLGRIFLRPGSNRPGKDDGQLEDAPEAEKGSPSAFSFHKTRKT